MRIRFCPFYSLLCPGTGNHGWHGQVFSINLLNKWKYRRLCMLTLLWKSQSWKAIQKARLNNVAFSISCPCCCCMSLFPFRLACPLLLDLPPWPLAFINFLSPVFHLISDRLWNFTVSLCFITSNHSSYSVALSLRIYQWLGEQSHSGGTTKQWAKRFKKSQHLVNCYPFINYQITPNSRIP